LEGGNNTLHLMYLRKEAKNGIYITDGKR